MGDSVNLASRLEGANKFYQTHAMVSQATYDGAKDAIDARRLDIIRGVWKTQPIMIYELLGPKGSMPGYMYEMLEIYYRGLDLFSEHQWRKARSTFREALKIVKDDGPSLTYVNRCEEFMRSPLKKLGTGLYIQEQVLESLYGVPSLNGGPGRESENLSPHPILPHQGEVLDSQGDI